MGTAYLWIKALHVVGCDSRSKVRCRCLNEAPVLLLTASVVPVWMMVTKARKRSSSRLWPKSSPNTRRCAVELTGRNSVRAWTTPSSAATSKVKASRGPPGVPLRA